MHRLSHIWIFVALAAFSVASLLLSLSWGSYPLSQAEVIDALQGQAESPGQQIVMQLRLPRALSAFVVGGLLSVAGALMQVLLRNPLADPYVLGVSGGASVAALGSIMLGISSALVPVTAFAGALLSMALVFVLARGSGVWSSERLLLTGIVIAAGWGAMINLLLILADTHDLHGMLFWLMGDLSGSEGPGWFTAGLLLALLLGMALARDLNVLLRGELNAAALGIATPRLRLLLFLLASMCTALAVTQAGSVGFVGLVVPHMVRLTLGSDHRLLLPASTLFGGSLLMLADAGSRSLLAPTQLPVGVVTAIVGVPLFLYLIQRGRKQQ